MKVFNRAFKLVKKIYIIRGQKVMPGFELAEIYGYETKRFNEQGIYMLRTVLKGELAVKQSKALIRTFRQIKDYIMEKSGVAVEIERKKDWKFENYLDRRKKKGSM